MQRSIYFGIVELCFVRETMSTVLMITKLHVMLCVLKYFFNIIARFI